MDETPRNTKRARKAPWLSFALLGVFSTASLTWFSYLHQSGLGITVNVKKITETIIINGSKRLVQEYTQPKALEEKSQLRQHENLLSVSTAPTQNMLRQPTSAPASWSLSVAKFNEIFVHLPACDPHDMTWTQMECSNFRARAMKRFQSEWEKSAYWDGSKIINDKSADARVNAELSF